MGDGPGGRPVMPYGEWPSPISPEAVVAAANAPGEVHVVVDHAGHAGTTVFWSESRPEEGGRIQLVRRLPDGTVADLLPDGVSARTRVHEYGGGAWIPAVDAVYFASWDDQRVYRLVLGAEGPIGDPEPVTPEPPQRHALRYADLQVTGTRLLAVRETHPAGGGPAEVVNEIVSIAVDASAPTSVDVLVSGPDFVMAPRVSPGGTRLAWIEWQHPSMPWDATTLRTAVLAPEADRIVDPVTVTGGPDLGESAVQPQWLADGTLCFASDRTGWWNLYRFDPVSGTVATITAGDAERAEPQWVFAMSRAAELADGRIVAVGLADGVCELRVFAPGDPNGSVIDTGFCDLSQLRAAGTRAYGIGAHFTAEPVVFAVDLGPADTSRTPAEASPVEVLAPARTLPVDESWFSRAQHVSFASGPDGSRVAHGLYYPPVNPDVEAPSDAAPPVIVTIHGGPTAAARPRLSLATQYWTSRGFAVIDVNYGGSVGYGRAFRDLLQDAWGVVDVEDCIAAVEYLAGAGLADRDRLCIRGGSAGGFTTLAALATSDTFAAGANLFGVADLTALAEETHKFESRYLDGLIGPYPEAAEVYRARSPLTHVDDLSSPLAVFQGLDDEVVPPNQSEMIVEALQAKGVPVVYLPFEGEGHGFRKSETVIEVLRTELAFYGAVLGFTPAGDPVEVPFR